MRIVLSGGERGSYRSVLLANGVRRIGVNLTQLSIPKRKELDLKEKFQDALLYLYTSENDEDTDRFDSFVRTHLDSLELIIGMPGYNGDWIGEKYVPVWNDGEDLERLAYLCEKVGRVAISDKALNKTSIPRIRQLHQRWGTTLIGLTSKTDMIEAIDWDIVIVSSWTSVVRYGETQIWDGHGLRRYPAQQKDSARRSNRAAMARLGIDYEEVMEDNIDEVSKMAIRSWLEWEMSNYGTTPETAYDPSQVVVLEDDDESEVLQTEGDSNYLGETDTRNKPQTGGITIAITPPEPRNSDERLLLPVMGIEQVVTKGDIHPENPDDSIEVDPKRSTNVTYKGGVLRNCDNCYLAPRCPAIRPGAECAYEIPVELKTKDQLMALIRAMLEMQSSRVMFAAFAEELEGQGMDPNLSKEMDRLINMIGRFKDISDTRDVLRVEMEARGSAGVLSRIFGKDAGEKARELSEPISSNSAAKLMSGMLPDIVDAEVVEEN